MDRRTSSAPERTRGRTATGPAATERAPSSRWHRANGASASRFVHALCRWYAALVFGALLFALGPAASAHDLAIDQVMLWPDVPHGTLRGELTLDPELSRSKDATPSAEHERRLIELLKLEFEVGVDGRELELAFGVRELWVRGGATLGDVVTFSAPLPPKAGELRVYAGKVFPALVVSVQRVASTGRVDTWSWLLGRGEWTPAYPIGTEMHGRSGWREGGPDVFSLSTGGGTAADDSPAGAAGPEREGAAPNGAHPNAPANGAEPYAAERDAAERDESARDALALGVRFVQLGFSHIVPGGIDHVLFIAGLVLGSSRRLGQVLLSLTLFTLAHTLTLALAQFHIVAVPGRFVEPAIALSIFLVGVDNLRTRWQRRAGRPSGEHPSSEHSSAGRPSLGRHAVVFAFGLIHGLGFASALSELAFERAQAVLALFSFNVGVELGQIAVAALLGLALHAVRKRRRLEHHATIVGSALVAASGLLLTFERVAPPGAASSVFTNIAGHRHVS